MIARIRSWGRAKGPKARKTLKWFLKLIGMEDAAYLLNRFLAVRRLRTNQRRREQELLWEAHELLAALGAPAGSPEKIRELLLKMALPILRAHKANQDKARAAAAMDRLIKDPATPRPGSAEAGLN